MQIYRNSGRITLTGSAYLMLALMVLVLPLRWVAAWLFAGAVHEICHLFALRLFGERIHGARIGATGTALEIGHMSYGRELLCALAGPAGGLALLAVGRWLPRTAVCAAFQSAYNLLPVYPLDGGRALRCVIYLLFPTRIRNWLCGFVEGGCLGMLLLFGIYGTCFLKLGAVPLILAIVLILKSAARKIPCKPGRFHVQ